MTRANPYRGCVTHADLSPTPPAADAPWWRSAVVYQVYPRSFADADGDGMGDLRGVIDHLDHITDLGADVIWLSPVYRSPQDDNGYDISDYQDIDPLFGTLADLDELLQQAHSRGLRVVMDLVVNHTSDEHAWFVESKASRDNPKADWFIWRDPKPGTVGGEPGAEPNNWGSAFSGSAWEWCPGRGQYFLHIFTRKQPDLDWENPEVREAVYSMMRWWLDRGVDGFRMDVINLISKAPGLPEAPMHPSGYGDCTSLVVCGPRLLEWLQEMKREVFDARPGTYLTVGEMPGVTAELARVYTDRDNGPLNMVFQFEHVDLDADGLKWLVKPVTPLDIKRSLAAWQDAMGDRGWNSLYWCNHDQPRIVSRYGNDGEFWRESATALATVLHLHRGTPYVYQGEELGMTNVPFASIDDYRDIETLNFYAEAVGRLGFPADDVMTVVRQKSRDNARTPMQWSAAPHGGFTTGEPWLPVNPNASWLNAEAQRDDPRSVLAHYRALIRLRHEDPIVVDGDFSLIQPDHPTLYAFARTLGPARVSVYANLSDESLDVTLDPADVDAALVLGNYPDAGAPDTLRPWEARILRS